MSRWGGIGDQKYPIHFSGDIKSTWETYVFEIEFTVRSSNSGCYFWTHDIGGFFGGQDGELYTRWLQFGAFSAALRLHSAGEIDRRPWKWGDENLDAMKQAMQLRAQLMPYIYTAAWQCSEQNKPLLRPLYLEWPEEEAAYTHTEQYLFGDHLLVAPVTKKLNEEARLAEGSCWLPPGEWIDWWTGESFEGAQTIEDHYPLDRFPLYVRSGAVIPMRELSLRPTCSPIRELTFHCFPGNDPSKSTTSWFYDDDGESATGSHYHLSKLLLCSEAQKQELRIETLAGEDFDWNEQTPALKIEAQGQTVVEKERYPSGTTCIAIT